MRCTRLSAACTFAATIVLAGCAKETSPTPTHALSGHVRLVGHLVASDGRVGGIVNVDDANGVRVELLRGTQVVAVASTVHGDYRFTGLAPGGYAARSTVLGPVHDSTATLTITEYDLGSRDTLVLASAGDLLPVPNPMGVECVTYFTTSVPEHIRMNVLDLTGALVRTISEGDFLAGEMSTPWTGVNTTGNPVAAGPYWITFDAPGDQRACLVLK